MLMLNWNNMLELANAVDIRQQQPAERKFRRCRIPVQRRNTSFDIPEVEFVKTYRLGKETVRGLVEELNPFIPKPRRNDGVSAETKVLIALAFYASGSYQSLVGKSALHNVSQVTVSRAVTQVTDALNNIFHKYVKWPTQHSERNAIKAKFYEKFSIPGVLGCIGGTHVSIIKPHTQAEKYYNRQGFHSLNVMIICDSDLNILCVDASNPGSTLNSTVWQSHSLSQSLTQLIDNGEQGIILGDSGYPLTKIMMPPILHTIEGTPQHDYSLKHAAALNSIERCIRELKARFRRLRAAHTLHYNPITAAKIVKACCVLHNIANMSRAPVPLPPEETHADVLHLQQTEVGSTMSATPINVTAYRQNKSSGPLKKFKRIRAGLKRRTDKPYPTICWRSEKTKDKPLNEEIANNPITQPPTQPPSQPHTQLGTYGCVKLKKRLKSTDCAAGNSSVKAEPERVKTSSNEKTDRCQIIRNSNKRRIVCINCNISLNDNAIRRHPVFELDTNDVSTICEWISPVLVTEKDYICNACKEMALSANNVGLGSEASSSTPRGDTHTCIVCEISLSGQPSDLIVRENPSDLQQAIKTEINRRTPREVTASDRVCHPCWLSVERTVLHVQQNNELLPKLEPEEREPEGLEPVWIPIEANFVQSDHDEELDKPGTVILNNYKRAANIASRCIFHGCQHTDLDRVSDALRVATLRNYKYYIPLNARVCGHHLQSNNWDILFNSENSFNTFTVEQVEHVFTFANIHNTVLDFSSMQTVELIDENIFVYWVGMSKQNFKRLINEVPQVLEIEKGLLGLGALLIKMKTEDSDERLSVLLDAPKRTLDMLMDKVKEMTVNCFAGYPVARG